MNYVQPIRDTELVNAISDYIKERFGFKYQVMYEIGINTGLRISDILSLQFWHTFKPNEVRPNGSEVSVLAVNSDAPTRI